MCNCVQASQNALRRAKVFGQGTDRGSEPENWGDLQMTLKDAKAKLAFVNVALRKRDGEYRVNFKDGKEATAYYTDCLEDAVVTGLAMADCAPLPGSDVERHQISTGDDAGLCQACGKASEVK